LGSAFSLEISQEILEISVVVCISPSVESFLHRGAGNTGNTGNTGNSGNTGNMEITEILEITETGKYADGF